MTCTTSTTTGSKRHTLKKSIALGGPGGAAPLASYGIIIKLQQHSLLLVPYIIIIIM